MQYLVGFKGVYGLNHVEGWASSGRFELEGVSSLDEFFVEGHSLVFVYVREFERAG